MKTYSREQIEAKLRPETIATNVITASLYLTAYELLKSAIIDDTKSFFQNNFVNGDWVTSPEYETKVKAMEDDVFKASCMFLQSMSVLTSADIEELRSLRAERNKIAHELPAILLSPEKSIDVQLFHRVYHYLALIGRFWARVDMDIQDDPRLADVKDEEITPGRMAGLMLVMHALGLAGDSAPERNANPNVE